MKIIYEIILNSNLNGTDLSITQDDIVGTTIKIEHDNNLISALALPTDISNTVTFDSNSSYGIINGKRHNGVRQSHRPKYI